MERDRGPFEDVRPDLFEAYVTFVDGAFVRGRATRVAERGRKERSLEDFRRELMTKFVGHIYNLLYTFPISFRVWRFFGILDF